MLDYLQKIGWMALKNVSREKKRSALTLLGVLIGISAVVALFSLSGGLRVFVGDQLSQLGEDIIFVSTSGGGGAGGAVQASENVKFSDSDVLDVRSVQGIEKVWMNFRESKRVVYRDEGIVVRISGMEEEGREVLAERGILEVLDGRFVRENELDGVVVTKEVAEDGFDREIRVGKSLDIDGMPFEVVGIVEFDSGPFGGNSIMVSARTFRDVFGIDKASSLTAVASDDPTQVEERLERKLDRTRGEENYQIVTGEDRAEVVNNVIGLLDVVLGGVAAISLVIGLLGITNTMYMSITEKRREIGIMKALGATKGIVLSIFAVESGLLGTLGGALGVLLGFAMAKLVEGRVASYIGGEFSAVVNVEMVLQVLLFSFFIGTLAGALPVRNALKLKPVEAMR